MTSAEPVRENAAPGYSWIILTGLGALLALSALFILFAGVDPSDFEASTSVAWEVLSTSMPEVATYLERLVRLAGVAFLGFALFGTVIAFGRYRKGARWAWTVLWIFPVILGMTALMFFLYGATGLGLYYAGVAVIALLALGLPYRRFFPRGAA